MIVTRRENYKTLGRISLVLIALIAMCTCARPDTITSISAGLAHAAVVKSDGSVWTWGDNRYGQLGDGSCINRSVPTRVPGLEGATAVSAAYWHTVVVKRDGSVWAWGHGNYGQLGDGGESDRLTPVQVSGIGAVSAVAAGGFFTAALTGDGNVWAWGMNANGQLGDGTTTNRLNPVQVIGISGITAISAGVGHTVALKSDGTVWTWGVNSRGQLGYPTSLDPQEPHPTPTQIPGFSDVSSVSAAGDTTILVRRDGTVWACGDDYGRTPVQVPGLAGVTAAAPGREDSGFEHTVALGSDGSLWSWGDNSAGQLGDGSTESGPTPKRVLRSDGSGNITGITAVSAGEFYTLALAGDGSVWIWGTNRQGMLGQGTTDARVVPGQVTGIGGVTAIAAGKWHTLARKSDGTVIAWGRNDYGQLGDGHFESRSTAVAVQGLTQIRSISAGELHSIALRSDGTVWTWGWNDYGQLGDGTTLSKAAPVQVPLLSGIVAVAAGDWHSLALRYDGTVWAWGYNDAGVLGDGTMIGRLSPVEVDELSDVDQIAAGGAHSLALTSNGGVYSWGYNDDGQVGSGSFGYSVALPNRVQGLPGAVGIAGGDFHSLAIAWDGTAWAWGDDWRGQLGDGANSTTATPVRVADLAGVVSIDGGGNYDNSHSVALRGDGIVWTWGWNQNGQIGDGTVGFDTSKSTPVRVPGLSGVTAVSAGGLHTVALTADGAVWTWGDDSSWQLGDASALLSNLPITMSFSSVAPHGVVMVNSGGDFASSRSVTLMFSVTNGAAPVTEMRISNDGVFDSESWEPYSPTRVWQLSLGDGRKAVFARFRDALGNESQTSIATIMLDTTPPAISSVIISPALAAAGDIVQVAVEVSDLDGVVSVTADGIPLTQTGTTTWTGEIPAAAATGDHPVTIEAIDGVGLIASDASHSYRNAGIVGITGKSARHAIMAAAVSKWLFRCWGRVTVIDSDSFSLDDGSGVTVKVIAPGYSGFSNGDYVSARGVLDVSGAQVTMTTAVIRKLLAVSD